LHKKVSISTSITIFQDPDSIKNFNLEFSVVVKGVYEMGHAEYAFSHGDLIKKFNKIYRLQKSPTNSRVYKR